MNALGIELNNYAVAELKQGHLVKAFELLTYACEKTILPVHYSPHHVDSEQNTYQYAWEDCSRELISKKLHSFSKFNEGCQLFLCFKFLTIETPLGRHSVDHLCPCGFAWVLWYNLGIVSALLGSPVGATGISLLKQSLLLFERVQSRIDPKPISKHWTMLQLSILNNQACVLSDLSMYDQILDRLVQMGLTLSKASMVLDPSDQDMFSWTVQKLIEDKFAAAA